MNKYKIRYLNNDKICKKTIYENELNEFEYDIIKIKQIKDLNSYFKIYSHTSREDILQMFSQINMMLNANISFIDTLDLLIKSEKSKIKFEILNSIRRCLQQGRLLENELEKYKKYLGELSISFLSLGQKNGNIKESIQIIVDILEKQEQTKKSYIEMLSYPILLSITFFISLGVIFGYVVPQFEPLFAQYGNHLPLVTKILLEVKQILNDFSIYFLIILLSYLLILYFSYKKFESFKQKFDKFLLTKVPIISRLILLSNLLIIFLTLKSLLKQKYTFQESIHLSITVIQNSYLKIVFKSIEDNILQGKSIQSIFDNIELFDEIIKKLITIGHSSNQFELVLDKIVYIYQIQYDRKLKKAIRLIEPLFLIVIALLIVWMMLAIFIPMWDMNKVM